jgi:hypothetical protein
MSSGTLWGALVMGYFFEPTDPPRFSGIAKPGGGVAGS